MKLTPLVYKSSFLVIFSFCQINSAEIIDLKMDSSLDEDEFKQTISRSKTEPVIQTTEPCQRLVKSKITKSLPSLQKTLSDPVYFEQKYSFWEKTFLELEASDPSFFSKMLSKKPSSRVVSEYFFKIVSSKKYGVFVNEKDKRGRVIVDIALTSALNKKINQIKKVE